MEGQFRRRPPAADGQVRQDKFPAPLEAQFRRDLPPTLTFRHFRPQKNGTVDRLSSPGPNTVFSEPCRQIRVVGKPATSSQAFQLGYLMTVLSHVEILL